MKENGFNHGDVYAVKNGKRNGSVGSPFYADENGFRIQFKVAGPFATRDEASVDGYQLAEKNSSDAKANFSELNAGKNLGTTHWNFKGFTFGVNRNAKKIALAFGRKDIKEQGFHPGAVSRNILGNPENNHHKGFTFVRISDPEELLILAGQYLEDGYDFHHELTEKNFLMLCDTSP